MSIYVAATRQNDGKTAVSLGLSKVLQPHFENMGYMKPVGQHYQVVSKKRIDKDAVLMNRIFNFNSPLENISPVAIPRGFTEKYILNRNHKELVKKIKTSYAKLQKQHDFVVIEGTGHAGVGSVFDLSNAHVAKLLGAKVILVSSGGIGRPIDEIMLNYPTFQAQGVEVMGVIINKVRQDKYKRIKRIVTKGLKQKGLEVLGVIPFENVLSNPSVSELIDDLGGELICGEGGLHRQVENFVIGDMVPYEASSYLSGGSLLIVPGNREGLIFAALSDWVLGVGTNYLISGIVATSGKRPDQKVIDVINKINIPLIVVKEDSFTTACRIDRAIFKVRAEDQEKIHKTEALVQEYVDIDRILKLIKK